jgi:hypothetical protein
LLPAGTDVVVASYRDGSGLAQLTHRERNLRTGAHYKYASVVCDVDMLLDGEPQKSDATTCSRLLDRVAWRL